MKTFFTNVLLGVTLALTAKSANAITVGQDGASSGTAEIAPEDLVTIAPVEVEDPIEAVAPIEEFATIEAVAPIEEVAPIEAVTSVGEVSPVEEVAPVETVTPVGESTTEVAPEDDVMTIMPIMDENGVPIEVGPIGADTTTPEWLELWPEQTDEQIYAGLSDETLHFIKNFTPVSGERVSLEMFLTSDVWDAAADGFFTSLLEAKESDYLWFRDSSLVSSVLYHTFATPLLGGETGAMAIKGSLDTILDMFGSELKQAYVVDNYAASASLGPTYDEFETFIEDLMYDTLRDDKGTHIDKVVQGLFNQMGDAREEMQTARQIITAVMAKVEALEIEFQDLFSPVTTA